MPTSDLLPLLEQAVVARGQERVARVLIDLIGSDQEPPVLTIVANAGVHEIPPRYLRGDVYEASRGNWDASSEAALVGELTRILEALARKLRARRWERVYLIPTGHPILSVNIKSMVYRILRMNTVDLYYSSGAYFEVSIDQRAVALRAGHGVEAGGDLG